MKIFLTRILPLLLPLILFGIWLYLARRKAKAAGNPMPRLGDAPWAWLAITGMLTLVIGLLTFGLFAGEEPGGNYIPPHIEDGKVVPGRIER